MASDELKQVLAGLDPNDDAQWTTTTGEPLIAYLVQVTGNEDIRRADIVEADPTLTRQRLLDEQKDKTEQAGEKPPKKPTREMLEKDIEALTKQVVSLGREQEELKEKQVALDVQIFRKQREHDALLSQGRNPNPIQSYLASVQKIDTDREEKRSQLIKAGVDMQGLNEIMSGSSKVSQAAKRRKANERRTSLSK